MSTSVNRYFLRSVMEQSIKSNSDVNIANNINLELPSTTASEVHFQTTSSSALPPTSSPLNYSQMLTLPNRLLFILFHN